LAGLQGVVQPPHDRKKILSGFLALRGGRTTPMPLGDGRTTPVALGGGSATPNGQNPSIFFWEFAHRGGRGPRG